MLSVHIVDGSDNRDTGGSSMIVSRKMMPWNDTAMADIGTLHRVSLPAYVMLQSPSDGEQLTRPIIFP